MKIKFKFKEIFGLEYGIGLFGVKALEVPINVQKL